MYYLEKNQSLCESFNESNLRLRTRKSKKNNIFYQIN